MLPADSHDLFSAIRERIDMGERAGWLPRAVHRYLLASSVSGNNTHAHLCTTGCCDIASREAHCTLTYGAIWPLLYVDISKAAMLKCEEKVPMK